jgi:dipeptidyl aminopeptidase/acylaminoacyl peptidase
MSKLLPPVLIALLLGACVSAGGYVTYRSNNPELSGRLCKPEGPGPFPAVIFNHGGLGAIIGGAPDATCTALSKAGYVGFAPIRRLTRSLFGHLDDVEAALDFVKSVPGVDPARVGMIGFSRGAMLSYQFAAGRRDIKALVLMAAAAGRRADIGGRRLGCRADPDAGGRQRYRLQNHHGRQREKPYDRIGRAAQGGGAGPPDDHLPPYGGDGHQLFFQVGAYWPDVTAFLDRHLKR